MAAEFYVNATSPRRPFRLNVVDAIKLVNTWFALPTVDLTPALVRIAFDLQQRFPLSYWDAAILAAAKLMSCPILYSEDLNHGQNYDGVTVINPFTAVPAS